MKMYFRHKIGTDDMTGVDCAPLTLQDSIEKTRQALNDAYAGFDNALEVDLIDSYIYEIYALQKRYTHLSNLAAAEPAAEADTSRKYSPVRALVSHVLG